MLMTASCKETLTEKQTYISSTPLLPPKKQHQNTNHNHSKGHTQPTKLNKIHSQIDKLYLTELFY